MDCDRPQPLHRCRDVLLLVVPPRGAPDRPRPGPVRIGHLGTVAVMDTEPHDTTPGQLEMLTDLAAVIMDQLELRLSAMNALRDGRPRQVSVMTSCGRGE